MSDLVAIFLFPAKFNNLPVKNLFKSIKISCILALTSILYTSKVLEFPKLSFKPKYVKIGCKKCFAYFKVAISCHFCYGECYQMANGKRVEKFRENAKFTEQDVSKHLKTVTDVKVLQADGLIPV